MPFLNNKESKVKYSARELRRNEEIDRVLPHASNKKDKVCETFCIEFSLHELCIIYTSLFLLDVYDIESYDMSEISKLKEDIREIITEIKLRKA